MRSDEQDVTTEKRRMKLYTRQNSRNEEKELELKNMSDLSGRETTCSCPLLETHGQYPDDWRGTIEEQEVKVCMENEGNGFPEYNDTHDPRAFEETNVENGFDNHGNRVDIPKNVAHEYSVDPVTNSLRAASGCPCRWSAWLKYIPFVLALVAAAIGGGFVVIVFQQTADFVHTSPGRSVTMYNSTEGNENPRESIQGPIAIGKFRMNLTELRDGAIRFEGDSIMPVVGLNASSSDSCIRVQHSGIYNTVSRVTFNIHESSARGQGQDCEDYQAGHRLAFIEHGDETPMKVYDTKWARPMKSGKRHALFTSTVTSSFALKSGDQICIEAMPVKCICNSGTENMLEIELQYAYSKNGTLSHAAHAHM